MSVKKTRPRPTLSPLRKAVRALQRRMSVVLRKRQLATEERRVVKSQKHKFPSHVVSICYRRWRRFKLPPLHRFPRHSMTLSARATNVAGTVTPIALAVLRLITSSNLVGCSTGMSATLVPRRSLRVCWSITSKKS